MDSGALREFFDLGDSGTIPVMPSTARYAARVRGLGYNAVLSDPTALSNASRDICNSFHLDGLVVCTEPALEAEALGCSIKWSDDVATILSVEPPAELPASFILPAGGRLAGVAESVKRVSRMLGQKSAVFAGISGPVSLASRLTGVDAASGLAGGSESFSSALELSVSACVSLAKMYCESGVSGIEIIEDAITGVLGEDAVGEMESSVQTVLNVMEYYRAIPLLGFPRCTVVEAVQPLFSSGVRGVALASQADHKLALEKALEEGIAYGADIMSGMEDGRKPDKTDRGYFISGEIPSIADVNDLADIISRAHVTQ